MFAETDWRMEARIEAQNKRREENSLKTEAAIRKLGKEGSRLRDLFESQWSRLLKALVDGKLVHLLRQRQIPVNHASSNVAGVSADGQAYEFDILAVNDDAVVVVEVKSRLQSDDVREFVNELKHFKSPDFDTFPTFSRLASRLSC